MDCRRTHRLNLLATFSEIANIQFVGSNLCHNLMTILMCYYVFDMLENIKSHSYFGSEIEVSLTIKMIFYCDTFFFSIREPLNKLRKR